MSISWLTVVNGYKLVDGTIPRDKARLKGSTVVLKKIKHIFVYDTFENFANSAYLNVKLVYNW